MSNNRRAVGAARERWNAGDLDGYLELYDDGIVLHGYSPEPLRGAEVRSFYESVFAGIPGQLAFDDILEIDSKLVLRFTLTSVHSGEFMGQPASGREVVLPGITILRFAGDTGKCVERWSQADMLGFMIQIGAVAPPA